MGEAEVIAEQKKASRKPYFRVHLTKSEATTYTYASNDSPNRVMKITQKQDVYSEETIIVLNNYDQALNDIDFKGYKMELGWGFIIDGTPDYIDQPDTYVIDKVSDSLRGKLTVTLICYGIMSLLEEDHASVEWNAGDSDDMKDLIEDLLDATLSPFSHCHAWTSDWTGVTPASDVNLFNPAENFKVFLNSTRLSMLRYLLEHTYVYARPAADGTIDMIKPTTSGEVYDYEYKLTAAGEHRFLSKVDREKLTIPNYVVVYGGEYDYDSLDYTYSGNAQDTDSINDFEEVRYYEAFSSIESNAECSSVAAAILSDIQLNKRAITAMVPMNCTAKLMDYIKITDDRDGTTATGNIGKIVRTWQSGIFQMEVGFGGWLTGRKIADFVSKTYRPPKETTFTPTHTINDGFSIDSTDDEGAENYFPIPNGWKMRARAYAWHKTMETDNAVGYGTLEIKVGDDVIFSLDDDQYAYFAVPQLIHHNESGDTEWAYFTAHNSEEMETGERAWWSYFITYELSLN